MEPRNNWPATNFEHKPAGGTKRNRPRFIFLFLRLPLWFFFSFDEYHLQPTRLYWIWSHSDGVHSVGCTRPEIQNEVKPGSNRFNMVKPGEIQL